MQYVWWSSSQICIVTRLFCFLLLFDAIQANEAQELGSGEAVVVAVPCSHESSKTASTNDELIKKLIKQTSVEDEKKRVSGLKHIFMIM